MHNKTLMSFKVDKSLKSSAQKIAEEIGVPLSTLINAFLRQFVRDEEVNFSLYVPTKRLKKAIGVAEKEYTKGTVSKAGGVDDLMKRLRS
jgi:addiction module RelB/DinJ family antitoxin